MLLKWFQASDATQVGTALADDFVLHSAPGTEGMRRKADDPHAQGQELRKFLGKFLQRVDRETHLLKLNLFKRAKLANSFKWRLLEKGVEQPLVEELTQALVLRLTSNQGVAVPSGAGASGTKHRSRSRETQAHADPIPSTARR